MTLEEQYLLQQEAMRRARENQGLGGFLGHSLQGHSGLGLANMPPQYKPPRPSPTNRKVLLLCD